MAEIPKLTDQEINDVIKIHPNPAELSELKTKGREHRSLMKRLRDYIEQEFDKQWTLYSPNTNYPPNYRGMIVTLDNSTKTYTQYRRTSRSLTGAAPFIHPADDTSREFYNLVGTAGQSFLNTIPFYNPNTLYQFGTEPILVKHVVLLDGENKLRIFTLKDNETNNPSPNDYTLNPAETRPAPDYDANNPWLDVGYDVGETVTGGEFYKPGNAILFGNEAGTQIDPKGIHVNADAIHIGAKIYEQNKLYYFGDFVTDYSLTIQILVGITADGLYDDGTPPFNTTFPTMSEAVTDSFNNSPIIPQFAIVGRAAQIKRLLSQFSPGGNHAQGFPDMGEGVYYVLDAEKTTADNYYHSFNAADIAPFLMQTVTLQVMIANPRWAWADDGQTVFISTINGTVPPLPAWPGSPYTIEYKFLKASNGKMNLVSVSGQSTGGGTEVTVVQSTGQSTTDVMSQKAVTDALAGLAVGGFPGYTVENIPADLPYTTKKKTNLNFITSLNWNGVTQDEGTDFTKTLNANGSVTITGVPPLVSGTGQLKYIATGEIDGGTPANTPPVANAGTDQTLATGTTSATISGSATDTDGTIAAYAWSTISGGATITNPNSATTSVTGLTTGANTFRLTVTDNEGATHTDEVTVTVAAASGNITPTPPTWTGNDQDNTLTLSHPDYANSELEFRTSTGEHIPYTNALNVGNAAIAAGNWLGRVKATPGRDASAEAPSPAFTVGGTPISNELEAYFHGPAGLNIEDYTPDKGTFTATSGDILLNADGLAVFLNNSYVRKTLPSNAPNVTLRTRIETATIDVPENGVAIRLDLRAANGDFFRSQLNYKADFFPGLYLISSIGGNAAVIASKFASNTLNGAFVGDFILKAENGILKTSCLVNGVPDELFYDVSALGVQWNEAQFTVTGGTYNSVVISLTLP